MKCISYDSRDYRARVSVCVCVCVYAFCLVQYLVENKNSTKSKHHPPTACHGARAQICPSSELPTMYMGMHVLTCTHVYMCVYSCAHVSLSCVYSLHMCPCHVCTRVCMCPSCVYSCAHVPLSCVYSCAHVPAKGSTHVHVHTFPFLSHP